MTSKSFILILSSILVTSGCNDDGVKVTTSQELHSHIGQRVILVGVAKIHWVGVAGADGHGAMLDGGDGFHIWLDDKVLWPTNYVDHQIQVEGVLMQKHQADLTNYYDPEPVLPGMSSLGVGSVQKGFDFYVVHNAGFRLLP